MRTQKRFVPAKYDFAFKELMKNETVRRHFLAAVLGIPAELIRTSRLLNTFLWQQYRGQKLGILDVLVGLGDGTRVDIEIQVKPVKHWDRRATFYLAKLFTDDLRRGEDYGRAGRTISISLLDFRLREDEKYHRVCRLRYEDGEDFSDLLEIHVIELCKELKGEGPLDDWIRLLNAETEEELEMIRTEDIGITEAIKELRIMGLGKSLRAWHENKLKYERDRRGELEYAREEGLEQGRRQGLSQGLSQGLNQGFHQGMERINRLYAILQEQGRTEDIARAIRDAAYREELLKEYKL